MGKRDLGPEKDASGGVRRYKGALAKLTSALAIAMSLYQLLYVSAAFELLGVFIPQVVYLATSLCFVLVLIFLLFPMSKRASLDRLPLYDVVLIVLSMSGTGYVAYLWSSEEAFQYVYATTEGVILGLITAALVLEATRRMVGWVMPLIVLLFLLYTKFCNYFPGLFHGRGYALERMAGDLYIAGQGILGLPLAIAFTIVVAYIMFSQFLFQSGAGKFFIDLAYSLVGHVRGGPAKVAVIASAIFGTLSGSPVGNVASTGAITIPMMKGLGYKPHFAAAVEAVSSNGGQLMPPVMGAVIFIMCEFLGLPYWSVCVAAALPALLYFLAVFLMVDAEAVITGLRGLPRSELPSFKRTIRSGWYFFVPLFLLISLLGVARYAPERAAIYALVALLLVSMVRKQTRLGFGKICAALRDGGKAMLTVAITCAAAGLILGSLSITGLGIKLSSLLVHISRGSLPLLLVLAAFASFIMGMGVTVTACYIMLAILVAPALIELGVLPLAAHFFVLYWGLVSFITPPVAIAVFAASAIAGSDALRTGFTATRLGVVTYIIPFMFVYAPALLMKGSAGEVAITFVTSIVGCMALAAGLGGYLLIVKVNWVQRPLLLLASLLLLFPGWHSDLIGFGVLSTAMMLRWRQSSRH
ncbi:MAG: TRAP transporter permease [Deltaproteobacteria bacterium]|nr:MAG: TRAP transporter permease [Deltaproteobacteria bacterium]